VSGAAPNAQDVDGAQPAGRWEWAAYPGQEPQWYWFPDPAADAVPGGPQPPTVWSDFRRRARRVGVLLLVLGFVCTGAIAYGELTDDGPTSQVALDVDGDPLAPGTDAGVDPGIDAGIDAGTEPAPPADAAPADAVPQDPAPADAAPAEEPAQPAPEEQPILDELADTLRARAQAATDAMLGGDAQGALEYIEPSCRDAVRRPMESAIAAAQAAFAGVRMVVASVTVTAEDGKVVYRVDGEPSEAAAEFAIATEEQPELWVHRDGHWYRDIAECRVGDPT
jgi:hypothetical protein